MNQSQEDGFHIQLKTSQSPRTYLITYSQVHLSTFATRRSFGEQVVAYFNEGAGKVEVEHWACCREPHDTTSGIHYHLYLELRGQKRWKRVKEKLTNNHGHDNYYTAYRYVTKIHKSIYLQVTLISTKLVRLKRSIASEPTDLPVEDAVHPLMHSIRKHKRKYPIKSGA